MSVMEGLVMGLPVIAPEFGPFPYLVKDKINGLLYEPDSVEQLSLAINLLLDDYELYKKLSAGARSSGEQLKTAPTGFAEAIAAAMKFAARPVIPARS